MERIKFNISNDQARVFARAVYMNISAYIQSHQEEYNEFLLQLEENENDEI